MAEQQTYCTGCNLVVAPNAPGAYVSASPGVGRVHSGVCESKGIGAINRRRAALDSLDRSFGELRSGMSALLQKVRLSPSELHGVPEEFTGPPAGYGVLNAEVFAMLVGRALSVLYAACQNGTSHLRPEIMALAAAASKALGVRVRVRAAETETIGSFVGKERFEQRFGKRTVKARPAGRTAASRRRH